MRADAPTTDPARQDRPRRRPAGSATGRAALGTGRRGRAASRRVAVWTGLAGLLSGLAVGTAAPAAAADEVLERPPDGVFTLEGRGFGHGRGLSQWGAQGAARAGVPAEQIVAAYYPGTARGVLRDSPVRVRLMADEGRDTLVLAAAGLRVTDLATGTSTVLPDGPSRWRVVPAGSGLRVEQLTGSTWSAYALGSGALSGPVRFDGPSTVRVVFPDGSSRDYRGSVQAVRSGTGLATVVVLGLEDYLLGVVPREAPSSWHPAALQAQAIAARSYSAYLRDRVAAGAQWDICDTTACQVFGGSRLFSPTGVRTELEPASTSEAVRATRGIIRTYAGRPVFAEFSSSSGGWSARGGVPYQQARRDEWDDLLSHAGSAWRAALPATALEKRFPAVGTLRRIRVTGRDGNGPWGGRVTAVVLEGVSSTGQATRVTTTGEGVRSSRPWPTSSDGVRSALWRLTPPPAVAQSAAPPAPTVRRSTAATGPTSYGVLKGAGPRVLARDPRLVGRR